MALSGQAAPNGYVYVRVHLHVSGEDSTKCSAAPSSPPPVCALPSRQPYVKSPLSVCHVAAEFTKPALPLKRRCGLRSVREGHSSKTVTVRA